MSLTIQNVLVIGGSGSAGTHIVNALLNSGFTVSALTRESSSSTFPTDVKVKKADYTAESLRNAFAGQDAIVSAVPAPSILLQKLIIDTAIEDGVKIFIPSEFGFDTAQPNAAQVNPGLAPKIDVVNYLRSVENKISWSSIITGNFFDWSFDIPGGFAGWNIAENTATIYDGGNIPYEATTLAQIGRAVVQVLKHPEATKNRHVYLNSFTTTQNEVLRAFEDATSKKLVVNTASVEELYQDGIKVLKAGGPNAKLGSFAVIASVLYGKGGNLANYSSKLDNMNIDLPQENLQEVVNTIVAKKGWDNSL